jgi:hypothetical protein
VQGVVGCLFFFFDRVGIHANTHSVNKKPRRETCGAREGSVRTGPLQ